MTQDAIQDITYREAIQGLKNMFSNLYDYSNGLRDYASHDEKECWNELRRKMHGINSSLSMLDDTLSDARAKMKVHTMRTDDDSLLIIRNAKREI